MYMFTFCVLILCFALLQENMAIPSSTTLGVLGSLLCKPDLGPLKGYLEEVHGYLEELARLEEPTLKHRSWMKEVRELCYDMADHRDRKLMSVEKQVEEFRAPLKEAIERYKRYNLHGSPLQRRYVPVGHQPTQYKEVPNLCLGLADDLVRCLKNDEHNLLKVVAIVGPGGIGKTTLAKRLYQTVGGEFDCRAFVRVTTKPDMKRLMRDMLLQIRSRQPADACGLLELIEGIKEHLRHKRYLLKSYPSRYMLG